MATCGDGSHQKDVERTVDKGQPPDPEIVALLAVTNALSVLASDDARRRVIAYVQARCIKQTANGLYLSGMNPYAQANAGYGLKSQG